MRKKGSVSTTCIFTTQRQKTTKPHNYHGKSLDENFCNTLSTDSVCKSRASEKSEGNGSVAFISPGNGYQHQFVLHKHIGRDESTPATCLHAIRESFFFIGGAK